jgi:hypothetical protein
MHVPVFFHLKANKRKRKNFIPYLKNNSGMYIWDHKMKDRALYDHFHNILGMTEHRHTTINWTDLQLPILHDSALDSPFDVVEIKLAVDDLHAEKAPSLDGFIGLFYKVCWDIIKSDIVAAFQCLHDQTVGPLPKLNAALITLLPKNELAELPSEFRPISLLHSFAKLVTKVLARRLSPHISHLVYGAQSAFIKKCYIQDNFLYVRNLARAYQ